MTNERLNPKDAADTKPLPAPGRRMESIELDLSSCEEEPIHIPGSIQPHGFLLMLGADGRVQVASGNSAEFLGLPVESIFGRSLPELLGREVGERIIANFSAEPLTAAARLLIGVDLVSADGRMRRFEVVAHRSGTGSAARNIIEFEPNFQSVDVERINGRLFNFMGAIRRVHETEEICQALVEEVLLLTECDRVLLYRFDEQGNGLVLAEQRSSLHLSSYLGLRFPASDIPAQARRMYLLNRVRIIPNVDYQASPLVSRAGRAEDLDLSGSVLRSVSPVHRQYMRNMGTVCSMSVSIIIDGRLWGLLSCHHHEPRYVPIRLRYACDFLALVAASQMESQQSALHLQRVLAAKAVQARLLASMAGEENYAASLLRLPAELVNLVQADGVAIVVAMGATLIGVTPDNTKVLHLVEWFRRRAENEMFATSNLSAAYEPAREFTSTGSGVIIISVSKLNHSFILWFRRELVQTVRWAGDPQHSASAEQDGVIDGAVHPRHSFEQWLQIVRGCSEPWLRGDLESAAEFRAAVLEVVLKRVEELAALATGLQVANEELEAFSYSVSHDLRAPFRHISGFSEMLKEEESSRMSEKGKHYLKTIMDSARFAGLLVDSLLDFSRFARSKITMLPVNMEDLADHEWKSVLYDEANGREIEFSRSGLPKVTGDAQLLRQVLRNLFSNAVKYTARQPHTQIRMEATTQGQEFIFSIRDNGVGFDQQYADKLFGVFQRLHRSEDFEGTGIGLANVRRIVGRHGGRTWAEGEAGHGAAFFFSLPAILQPLEGS